jgi:hypothetical protein
MSFKGRLACIYGNSDNSPMLPFQGSTAKLGYSPSARLRGVEDGELNH